MPFKLLAKACLASRLIFSPGTGSGLKLSLAERLRMGHQVHGRIGGRHGDRSVERSRPFPCLH